MRAIEVHYFHQFSNSPCQSVELYKRSLKLFVDNFAPRVLRNGQSSIKMLLHCAQLALLVLKLTAKLHLALRKNVLTTTGIPGSRRKQCDACSALDTAREATNFDVGALRAFMLPEALLERVYVLNGLTSVHSQASLIETDVAVPTSTI